MKHRYFLFLVLGIISIGLFSCKKDTEVNIDTFKIEKEVEKITVGTTTASISGTYAYSGKINSLKVRVGKSEQLFGSDVFVAEVSGKAYSVNITGLQSGTLYHYRYEVDYGAPEDYLTEIDDFTTQSESPTVKTIEWQAIDSTTFRVLCEVVADGGSEVTERGICWNTYGNPLLDDETLIYANGGIGQYALRLENLEMSKKYYVRAYAKNASGVGFGEVLELQTGSAATKPSVSTVEMSQIGYNTAQCLGNVSSNGGYELLERGACWGLEADPTINVHHAVAEGTATGNYTVTLDGLRPSTTYHVRCYAINEKDIAYGEELTFTTTEGLPTVTTSAITEVTSTSAKGGGEVTDQGASNVTERGICWGTSHNPNVSGTHANSGTDAGSYTVSMNNLTPNETYYVRAYATNSQGIAYGAEVEFTAREGLPSVMTLDVNNITATTATAYGKVTDQGGSPVTERGVCWSIDPSPTTSDSHAHSGTGAGEYTVELTDLTPGTRYYVRAYAVNGAKGTAYGEQKEFTTKATLPTVVTGGINGTTASGEVTDEGGAAVTERGICWSTSPNPTTDGSHGSSGTGTGIFSVELTDLEPGTTYYVRAYATNAIGTAYGEEKTFTTEANLPTVTTGEVSNITQTTAQGSGNVTNDGGATVTERGVCWSTSHNPTISGSHANNGTGTGSFTVSMTGLTANTHYYVRAYAKNSVGVNYGNEVGFTTAQDVSAPTVTTNEVTNVTQTTATGGGNVTSDGGAFVTERGICWSTSHNPTTSGSHASNGTGTGNFTVNMTGLTPGTTYYVRAYAVNSQGTSYGSEVNFTTQQAVTVPIVTTAQVTNITQTTATGGGNVTSDGGASVTEHGICWGTSHNPTTSGSHASNGIGTGSYTVNMTGLTAGTTYYVRAYAINSAGTAYGNEVTFTTLQTPTYTVSVSANPTIGGSAHVGSVTGPTSGTYTSGQSCTVYATANSGYTFTNWREGNNVVSSNASYTFTVNSSRNLVANFASQVSLPTVTTSQVTNITYSSATGGGNVTSDGGATVTERGICWSTSHNPTTGHPYLSSGSGLGSFTVEMTGLFSNTTYYVRAYARNSQGIVYGNEVSFTTSIAPPSDEFFVDFENGIPEGWTTIDADGDGYTWILGSAATGVYVGDDATLQGMGHNSSADMMCSASYINGVGAATPDNYLVSPEVTLGGTFSFYACGQDSQWAAEHFGVAISTTNGYSASAFTTIQEWTMTAKSISNEVGVGRSGADRAQGNWYLFTVYLSDYQGQTGYVAIRHFNCTDMYLLVVDDIELSNGRK